MATSAPGIPMEVGGYDTQYHTSSDYASIDPTPQLIDMQRSVVEIPYGRPSFERGSRLSPPDYQTQPHPIYSGAMVGNQVHIPIYNYEAPDVPVSQLPYSQQLYNSTLVQATVNGAVVYNLRAPGINEGM